MSIQLDTPAAAPGLARASGFRDLPAWVYLWLPLSFYLFIYAAGFLLSEPAYIRYFVGEISVIEVPTVLVLIVAIVMGIRALRDARALRISFLPGWLLLGTLGCVYFAGEEASWGQWYFHWDTPEAWEALNKQDETNLHNLEGVGFLFDKLPRTLLTLGAILGGVLVPLYLRRRRISLDPARLWYWLWPTAVALPTAVLGAILARFDRAVTRVVGHDWPHYDMRTGEVKELLLAFFLMVYLASLAVRLRQLRDASGSR